VCEQPQAWIRPHAGSLWKGLFSPAKDAQGQAAGALSKPGEMGHSQEAAAAGRLLRVAYVLQPDGSLTDCSWQAEGGFQEACKSSPAEGMP
jgi:hypothetical protein